MESTTQMRQLFDVIDSMHEIWERSQLTANYTLPIFLEGSAPILNNPGRGVKDSPKTRRQCKLARQM
jgi:hypothetical protein